MIKAAGHSIQTLPRHYTKHNGLREKCIQWLRGKSPHSVQYNYDAALALLDSVESHRAQELLLDPEIQGLSKNLPDGDLGMFVNAIYVRSKEEVICHDYDIPLQLIGQEFDKILINKNQAGRYFGWKSTGLLINLGTVGYDLGGGAQGVIINAGKAGENAGACDGIFVNAGEAESLTVQKGVKIIMQLPKQKLEIYHPAVALNISEEYCAINSYLEQLINRARTDPCSIKNPQTIRKKLNGIVNKYCAQQYKELRKTLYD